MHVKEKELVVVMECSYEEMYEAEPETDGGVCITAGCNDEVCADGYCISCFEEEHSIYSLIAALV